MNIITIVLIVAFLFILMMVFKVKEVRHKMGFLVVACLCLFLALSFLQVYKSNKVDLKTFDGVVTAGKLYFGWIGQMFSNVKDVAGYAIKQDWAVNSTKLDKTK